MASDERLVSMSKDGVKGATDALLNRYEKLVQKCAGSFFLIGGEKEDLEQEGMIGILGAIRTYDKNKNDRFYPFAKLCINRQMLHAVETASRKKNQPLNSYISIDNNDNPFSEEYLVDELLDPERMLMDIENEKLLRNMILKLLSPYEREVLTLNLQGYDYLKIAEILNKDSKSVDNALQRIRSKVKALRK
jgi:RNA polymerase sporulation-specific sigma factor